MGPSWLQRSLLLVLLPITPDLAALNLCSSGPAELLGDHSALHPWEGPALQTGCSLPQRLNLPSNGGLGGQRRRTPCGCSMGQMVLRKAEGLRLRGGMQQIEPDLQIANDPVMNEIQETPMLDIFKDSLDPKVFVPMDPIYDERGDMVYPEPISLESIGKVNRLLDDTGKLLTTKEAQKLGVSKLKRKKKGTNSLLSRCICGNKAPCNGDVLITKNEYGKLEYHKIPRYEWGAAHPWESRQPAQYMVTPSGTNWTEAIGGAGPLATTLLAEKLGMKYHDLAQYTDEGMRNAIDQLACHFCNRTSHKFWDCPFTYDDDSDAIHEVGMRRTKLVEDLTNQSKTEVEKMSILDRIEHCDSRIAANRLYPPIEFRQGNKTYLYNQPGANWGEGDCTVHDFVKVNNDFKEPPDGDTIHIPEDYQDIYEAVVKARNGQSLLVDKGEHQFQSRIFVEGATAESWEPEPPTRFLFVKGSDLASSGLKHKMVLQSFANHRKGDLLEREMIFQNAAVLHGMWCMHPGTGGNFSHVSLYHRSLGYPGIHYEEELEMVQEEPEEIDTRYRLRILDESTMYIIAGKWTFTCCDLFCYDGVSLTVTGEETFVDLSLCFLGETGLCKPLGNGTIECEYGEGFGRIAVDQDGYSFLTMENCQIQMTDIYGLRMSAECTARLVDCNFLYNGRMGGAGLFIEEDSNCSLIRCKFECPQSESPIWLRSAALEADISAGGYCHLHLSDCQIIGHQWRTQYRPRFLEEKGTILTACDFPEFQPIDARQEAVKQGMKNPVQLWRDSRYEIWWPKHRLEEMGLKDVNVARDGTGQERHVTEDEFRFESDEEDVLVLLNSSKKIPLETWGWEGTMEDVYQTELVDIGFRDRTWYARNDRLEYDFDEGFRIAYKLGRARHSKQREALARTLVRLKSNDAGQRVEAAKDLHSSLDRGDLCVQFWLTEVLKQEHDEAVRRILTDALKALAVTPKEVLGLREQLASVSLDKDGSAGDQTAILAGIQFPIRGIPPAIRASVFPYWPIYPQYEDADQGPWLNSYWGPEVYPPESKTVSENRSLDTRWQEISDAKFEEFQEKGISFAEWVKVRPTKRIEVDLMNASDVAEKLDFTDKFQLSLIGMLDPPDDKELGEEIDKRSVDDWFLVLCEQSFQDWAIISLRSYANFWGIESEKANKARDERNQVRLELSVTQDFQKAIYMSQYLHLSHEEWRMLYPHLDSDKVFEVAPQRKLRRVAEKVQELTQKIVELKDVERFALMDAVYPKAKEMERLKLSGNSTRIEEVALQQQEYGIVSAFADGLIKFPFKVSPDGEYVIEDGVDRHSWQIAP